MWSKRKPKNRRFERKHVLDVKVSSQRRRQIWFRRLAMLLLLLGILGVGFLVVGRGGEWLVEEAVYKNPAFAIHNLEIKTDGVLSLEQLRAWAGVRLRSNLLKLDLTRIKRDLELVPTIESAAVERVLPHTLRIRITEREPIAQVPLPAYLAGSVNAPAAYTLDAKGYFMFPIEPAQRAVPAATSGPLPRLMGVPVAELRPGRRTEMPQIHAALRLLEAFQQSDMAGRVQVTQVDLSTPFVLKLHTAQPSTILFGLRAPEQQLRRWAAIHQHGQQLGRQLAWLDLSVANNVPVRWQEASAPPVSPPPSEPRTTPKRKHV